MSGARVLVVDDEPQILRALETTLRVEGYEVETAGTAEDALARAAMRPPEAIILDLVLPDGSGTDVCRELRSWTQVPIVILSAVGDEREKVAALDAGADDYVTKPFSGDELLARLRAVMRRAAPGGSPVVEVGELRIDLEKHAVFRNGERLQLTPHEFSLLRLFAENEGKLPDSPHDPAAGVGAPRTRRSRTTSTSTSRICGASSSAIQRDRATSSRSPAPVIASCTLTARSPAQRS